MDANIYGNCFSTNTDGVINKIKFEIYPNPTSGVVYLNKSKGFDNNKFVLRNLIGEKIKFYNFENFNGHVRIDLGDLNNGIYFLTNSQGGKAFSKKIIIVK